MAVLFVSDLHLSADRPDMVRLFHAFLEGPARDAEALWVLGDLFEYWAGDDDLADPLNAEVCAAFRALAESGVPVKVMVGNRDFLMGPGFAAAAGARMLADPTVADLHGTPTLLAHGDVYCLADTDYLAFREKVRGAAWQAEFLGQSLDARKAIIAGLRAKSIRDQKALSAEIMDVSPDAIVAALAQHGCRRMIHGHTHRPARHEHRVAGELCERWVLPDWYDRGGYLEVTAAGCALRDWPPG